MASLDPATLTLFAAAYRGVALRLRADAGFALLPTADDVKVELRRAGKECTRAEVFACARTLALKLADDPGN
jgi:hypothetical protein